MNTFEKVVHKAIHKQALNSAVRDLSTDDLIILKRNPNLIDAEVLDEIKTDLFKRAAWYEYRDCDDFAKGLWCAIDVINNHLKEVKE